MPWAASTISSAPSDDGRLRVTIAPLGDLTRRIMGVLRDDQTVKSFHFKGHNVERAIHERCVKTLIKDTKTTWVGFIGIDEFLVLRKHNHIVDFAQDCFDDCLDDCIPDTAADYGACVARYNGEGGCDSDACDAIKAEQQAAGGLIQADQDYIEGELDYVEDLIDTTEQEVADIEDNIEELGRYKVPCCTFSHVKPLLTLALVRFA